MNKMRYWIGVVSKDHVLNGVKLGIMQLGHGKEAPLKRLHKGDWLIYYSPKQSLDSKEICQSFTAIGEVADDEIFQFEMSPTFKPFRRKVDYKKCKELPIASLIDKLAFIKNKKHWGFIFQFGLIEIQEDDFKLISESMLV